MDIEKSEIAEELDHHRKILKELRRRLRERELQEVKHGINVPPEITSDIHDLTERVQRHESEMTRLQTLAAEDKEPLGEVEYRAVLAEIWEKSAPTYAGLTRLELIRLRHGILRERANELEQEVRAIVARELLPIENGQKPGFISSFIESISDMLDENGEFNGDNKEVNVLHVIELLMRIDSISYQIQVDRDVVYNLIATQTNAESTAKIKKMLINFLINNGLHLQPKYLYEKVSLARGLEFFSNIESTYGNT